jgi:CheY-like chemotaxis protein
VPDASGSILFVNDDLFFTARILSMLKRAGYQTDTATTREEALEKIAVRRPALVIFNLGAPRLGGIEMLRRIKTGPDAPRVLAFLSHVRLPAVREDALAAGADKLCANSAVAARLPALVREVLDDQKESQVAGRKL